MTRGGGASLVFQRQTEDLTLFFRTRPTSYNASNLTKRLFRRFATQPAAATQRTRLSVTQLEDRTVPTPVITIQAISNATEGGASGVLRLTRSDTVGALGVNVIVKGTAVEGTGYGTDGHTQRAGCRRLVYLDVHCLKPVIEHIIADQFRRPDRWHG